MKNKILIYGDSNLNIIDGSSVWITNLAKLLAQDKNNVVDVLMKRPIKNGVLINQIKNYSNVRIITPWDYIKKIRTVDFTNIAKVVKKIDELRDYSCIILRGKDVIGSIIETDLKDKLIPYITDFCQIESEITNKEILYLTSIYNSVSHMFVQTEEMREYLKRILKIDGKKFSILNPIVFSLPSVEKEKKSIIYAGKLAKEWYIEELIEIMKRIYIIDPEVKLYFVGNKFNFDLVESKEEILNDLKTSPNIVYIEQLSKDDTCDLVRKCELGYAFRSEKIDNDESLEISLKFLEYCSFNVPSILRRTKMYEKILKSDYPLFVDNVDDAVTKIINYFNMDKSQILERLEENFRNYNSNSIYNNIKDALYSYGPKKLRLLISGHDLKFLKPLIPYFQNDYEVVVQELTEYQKINKKENRRLLQSCDIIWCEWLLLNAAWYSKHVYPHQRLFIRAHRFEITKTYGLLLTLKNVEKIITVSYYYYEQFLSRFKIPRNKITVINNFVETSKYSKEKEDGYQYNLALIGAVPALKGLDISINILLKLLESNDKYKLYVAGKRPEEWPNSWNIPKEKKYFESIYKLIEDMNLKDRVIFTGWIDNKELLKKIGFVLSTSTLESFHLAPIEAMASTSIGLVLPWAGSEYIYPANTIHKTSDEIVREILKYSGNLELLRKTGQELSKFVYDNYDIEKIYSKIKKVME